MNGAIMEPRGRRLTRRVAIESNVRIPSVTRATPDVPNFRSVTRKVATSVRDHNFTRLSNDDKYPLNEDFDGLYNQDFLKINRYETNVSSLRRNRADLYQRIDHTRLRSDNRNVTYQEKIGERDRGVKQASRRGSIMRARNENGRTPSPGYRYERISDYYERDHKGKQKSDKKEKSSRRRARDASYSSDSDSSISEDDREYERNRKPSHKKRKCKKSKSRRHRVIIDYEAEFQRRLRRIQRRKDGEIVTSCAESESETESSSSESESERRYERSRNRSSKEKSSKNNENTRRHSEKYKKEVRERNDKRKKRRRDFSVLSEEEFMTEGARREKFLKDLASSDSESDESGARLRNCRTQKKNTELKYDGRRLAQDLCEFKYSTKATNDRDSRAHTKVRDLKSSPFEDPHFLNKYARETRTDKVRVIWYADELKPVATLPIVRDQAACSGSKDDFTVSYTSSSVSMNVDPDVRTNEDKDVSEVDKLNEEQSEAEIEMDESNDFDFLDELEVRKSINRGCKPTPIVSEQEHSEPELSIEKGFPENEGDYQESTESESYENKPKNQDMQDESVSKIDPVRDVCVNNERIIMQGHNIDAEVVNLSDDVMRSNERVIEELSLSGEHLKTDSISDDLHEVIDDSGEIRESANCTAEFKKSDSMECVDKKDQILDTRSNEKVTKKIVPKCLTDGIESVYKKGTEVNCERSNMHDLWKVIKHLKRENWFLCKLKMKRRRVRNRKMVNSRFKSLLDSEFPSIPYHSSDPMRRHIRFKNHVCLKLGGVYKIETQKSLKWSIRPPDSKLRLDQQSGSNLKRSKKRIAKKSAGRCENFVPYFKFIGRCTRPPNKKVNFRKVKLRCLKMKDQYNGEQFICRSMMSTSNAVIGYDPG